jgi:hypothetical protein
MDVWQSGWFNGVNGQECRIIFEQRGENYLELIEYHDGERHRFEWLGENLIRGMGFTRLGLRCMEIPLPTVNEVNTFVKSVPRGKKITRNVP